LKPEGKNLLIAWGGGILEKKERQLRFGALNYKKDSALGSNEFPVRGRAKNWTKARGEGTKKLGRRGS